MTTTLVLALAWVALTGQLNLPNALFGLLLGFGLARLVAPQRLSLGVLRRLPQALSLAAFLLYELLLANVRVASLVLARRPQLRPAILAVPIELKHDWQVALLAGLVTLTPGTLSIEVSSDSRTLFIHFLNLVDPERERRAIREGFEARIRRLAP